MAVQSEASKVLSDNRQAGHNFFLLDRYEAGIALTGTEVRLPGRQSAVARSVRPVEEHEAWLLNAHISEYSHGNQFNHSPVRKRKLLLHRREIDKLREATGKKGSPYSRPVCI